MSLQGDKYIAEGEESDAINWRDREIARLRKLLSGRARWQEIERLEATMKAYRDDVMKEVDANAVSIATINRLEKALRIAAGILSSEPIFSHKHPTEVYNYLIKAADEQP